METDIRSRAFRELKEGDPVTFILKEYNRNHISDRELGLFLISAIGCQSVLNTEGLHPDLSGPSGKGKTDAAHAMIHLLPHDYVWYGSVSPKFLYNHRLNPATVIFLDDIAAIDDQTGELIKTAITRFQEGATRGVRVGRGEAIDTLPPRCSWWISSVGAQFDEQVLNRFIDVAIDDSPETDAAVYFMTQQRAAGDLERFVVDDNVRLCREMIRILNGTAIKVKIPYAYDIEWHDKANRRNANMFWDTIMGVTSIRRFQREVHLGAYVATDEDFDMAKEIWSKVQRNQATKMTNAEIRLYDYLKTRLGEKVFRHEIIHDLAMKDSEVSMLINGRTRFGQREGGLKSKLRAFSEGREPGAGKYYILTKDDMFPLERYGGIMKRPTSTKVNQTDGEVNQHFTTDLVKLIGNIKVKGDRR